MNPKILFLFSQMTLNSCCLCKVSPTEGASKKFVDDADLPITEASRHELFGERVVVQGNKNVLCHGCGKLLKEYESLKLGMVNVREAIWRQMDNKQQVGWADVSVHPVCVLFWDILETSGSDREKVLKLKIYLCTHEFK